MIPLREVGTSLEPAFGPTVAGGKRRGNVSRWTEGEEEGDRGARRGVIGVYHGAHDRHCLV